MTPNDFIERERDMQEAQIAFPEMEMGEAYRKFMIEIKKKEPLPPLNTGDKSLEAAKAIIRNAFRRPCSQPGCSGEQVLQGVCTNCAAGKKGFLSQWECDECLYREFSKRPYLDWYEELSKKEEVQ